MPKPTKINVLIAVWLVILLTMPIYAETVATQSGGQAITSNVATVTYPAAVRFETKIFYVQNRYWVFFANLLDSSNMTWFTSSADGTNWASPTSLGDAMYDRGEALEVCLHGASFTVVKKSESAKLWYRCGAAQPDGTISWVSDWAVCWDALGGQLVHSISGTDHYVAVDSGGYPYITWQIAVDGVSALKIVKSDRNDGVWHTAVGYPIVLDSNYRNAKIIPLSNGRLYIVAMNGGMRLKGWYFNGSWYSNGEISSSNVLSEYRLGQEGWSVSPVTDSSSNVHMVFLSDRYEIIYLERTDSTGLWSIESVVETVNNVTCTPAASVNEASGTLTIFWKDYPTLNQIFLKRLVNGVWDSNPTSCVTEESLATPFSHSGDGDSSLNPSLTSQNNTTALLYITGDRTYWNTSWTGTLKVAYVQDDSVIPVPPPPTPAPIPAPNQTLTPLPMEPPVPPSPLPPPSPPPSQPDTFGCTGIGANNWGVTCLDYKGTKFTLTQSGTVTAISLYCKERYSNPTFSLQLAIYDTSKGLPNNLLAQTTKTDYTDGQSFAWRTQTLNQPLRLQAGDYVLTWHFSGSNFLVKYNVGGATTYYGASWNNAFPVTFGVPVASTNFQCSIYAEIRR